LADRFCRKEGLESTLVTSGGMPMPVSLMHKAT
jgi:hypothetical protein